MRGQEVSQTLWGKLHLKIKRVSAQNLEISGLIFPVSQVLQNIYWFFFFQKKNLVGQKITEVVSLPKLAFPMYSLDPKAGAQGTKSL